MIDKKTKLPKKKKLTIREKKFVKAKVQGKSNVEAYKEAGYSLNSNKATISAASSNVHNKPHIQQAIDDALFHLGATPEWAVSQLMKVAEQDGELGAKRLASKDILELHGWNKADRPSIKLDISNAFFGGGRRTNNEQPDNEIVEGEVVDAN